MNPNNLPERIEEFQEEHFRALNRMNKHEIDTPTTGLLSLQVDFVRFGRILESMGLVRKCTTTESVQISTLTDIKEALREYGLPTSGNKETLIARLFDNLTEEQIRNFPSFKQVYLHTEKGKRILQKYYDSLPRLYPSGSVQVEQNSIANKLGISIEQTEFNNMREELPFNAGDYDVIWAILQQRKLAYLRRVDINASRRNYRDMYELLRVERRPAEAVSNLIASMYCQINDLADQSIQMQEILWQSMYYDQKHPIRLWKEAEKYLVVYSNLINLDTEDLKILHHLIPASMPRPVFEQAIKNTVLHGKALYGDKPGLLERDMNLQDEHRNEYSQYKRYKERLSEKDFPYSFEEFLSLKEHPILWERIKERYREEGKKKGDREAQPKASEIKTLRTQPACTTEKEESDSEVEESDREKRKPSYHQHPLWQK